MKVEPTGNILTYDSTPNLTDTAPTKSAMTADDTAQQRTGFSNQSELTSPDVAELRGKHAQPPALPVNRGEPVPTNSNLLQTVDQLVDVELQPGSDITVEHSVASARQIINANSTTASAALHALARKSRSTSPQHTCAQNGITTSKVLAYANASNDRLPLKKRKARTSIDHHYGAEHRQLSTSDYASDSDFSADRQVLRNPPFSKGIYPKNVVPPLVSGSGICAFPCLPSKDNPSVTSPVASRRLSHDLQTDSNRRSMQMTSSDSAGDSEFQADPLDFSLPSKRRRCGSIGDVMVGSQNSIDKKQSPVLPNDQEWKKRSPAFSDGDTPPQPKLVPDCGIDFTKIPPSPLTNSLPFSPLFDPLSYGSLGQLLTPGLISAYNNLTAALLLNQTANSAPGIGLSPRLLGSPAVPFSLNIPRSAGFTVAQNNSHPNSSHSSPVDAAEAPKSTEFCLRDSIEPAKPSCDRASLAGNVFDFSIPCVQQQIHNKVGHADVKNIPPLISADVQHNKPSEFQNLESRQTYGLRRDLQHRDTSVTPVIGSKQIEPTDAVCNAASTRRSASHKFDLNSLLFKVAGSAVNNQCSQQQQRQPNSESVHNDVLLNLSTTSPALSGSTRTTVASQDPNRSEKHYLALNAQNFTHPQLRLLSTNPTSTTTPTTTTPPAAKSKATTSVQRNYKGLTRDRRVEANARERTRVHTIGAAFDALRRAVPQAQTSTSTKSSPHHAAGGGGGDQKLSKLSVLRIASKYILLLAAMNGLDYSEDRRGYSIDECIDLLNDTLVQESKVIKRC